MWDVSCSAKDWFINPGSTLRVLPDVILEGGRSRCALPGLSTRARPCYNLLHLADVSSFQKDLSETWDGHG